MAHYFPKEGFPEPPAYAPDDVFKEAHRYFQIGYTDVVLRNDETGELFLPNRASEPQKGTVWFVGGRSKAGETTQQSAARHVELDTGLSIEPGRFTEVSHFGIAHVTPKPQGNPDVRDAKNTVLVASLKPEEVDRLNTTVAQGSLSKEYDGGAWYKPEQISKQDFPAPIKQFLRDYFDHQVMLGALQEAASKEDQARSN